MNSPPPTPSRPLIAAVPGLLLPAFAVGLIVGISFVAQPAKFATPGANRLELIAAGSTIFSYSHLAQYVVLILLLLTPAPRHAPVRAMFCIGLFGALLTAQHFWLLPSLDATLQELRAGQTVDSRLRHSLYVAAEILKVALLSALSIITSQHAGQNEIPPTCAQATLAEKDPVCASGSCAPQSCPHDAASAQESSPSVG